VIAHLAGNLASYAGQSAYRRFTPVAFSNAVARSARFVDLDQRVVVDQNVDAAVLRTTIVINEQVPRLEPWVHIIATEANGRIFVRTLYRIEVHAVERDSVVP
jgi:hypothetical protein